MRRIYIFTYLLFVCHLSIGQTNLESNMIFGGNSSDVAKDIKVDNTKTALFLGAQDHFRMMAIFRKMQVEAIIGL